jgi:hypothetical protein
MTPFPAGRMDILVRRSTFKTDRNVHPTMEENQQHRLSLKSYISMPQLTSPENESQESGVRNQESWI